MDDEFKKCINQWMKMIDNRLTVIQVIVYEQMKDSMGVDRAKKLLLDVSKQVAIDEGK